MTGNQDDEAGADWGADWGAAMLRELRPMVEQAIAHLKAKPLVEPDDAAVDRRMRVVAQTARAIKLVDAVTRKAPGGRASQEQEDEMGEPERDESPETLQRIRDELEHRIESIRGVIERKTMAERALAGRPVPDVRGPAGTA